MASKKETDSIAPSKSSAEIVTSTVAVSKVDVAISEEKASTSSPGNEDQVPLSTSDPADTYSTFSHGKRIAIISIASIIGLLSPLSSNLYVPAIPAVASDLQVSTNAINLTITSYLILQGLSPTLWSAVGDSVGRRPLYMVMLTIYVLSSLGLALSPNYAAVLVLRATQAVGSASTTAVGAGLIGDLIHVSRRGAYMGNYSALAGVGTAFGPVLGGVFAEYTGWRSIFYFLMGLSAVLLLLLVLVIPETMRRIVDDGHVAPPKVMRPPLSWLDAPKTSEEHPSGTGVKKLRIDFKAPVRLFREPEVLCCIIFTGVCYTVWQMNMVATSTLYSENYGLSEFHIGLTYISNGIGSLCGSILTGKTLNWQYQRQLQKEQEAALAAGKDGDSVREVEQIEAARIKPVIIPTIGFLISVIAFGWTVHYKVHIAVPITFSFFIGGLDTVILAIFSTLVVDLFTKQSFSATACMNLSRCIIAAAGTSAIEPMIRAVGVGWAFTICALVALASFPLAFIELYYGKKMRKSRIARLERKTAQ